jgi:hypothetical protein
MTGRPFEIVGFILAEIEDVIFDGLTVARNMSYAHWISFILSSVTRVDEDGERVQIGPKDLSRVHDVQDTFQGIHVCETKRQTLWTKGYNS